MTRHRLLRIVAIAGIAILGSLGLVAGASAAGPPFPPPVEDQAVYDTAEAFRPATVQQVEAAIDAIEQRTGAEIAVFSQLVPCCETTAQAEQNARALMDQWGVGRRGFDDGLVILFDLNEGDACHGQVQLYAGPGYAAKFLTNDERQAIFDEEMLPLLRRCDLDGALLVAMQHVDAAATPEHAAQLSFFRILNAALGLLVAPMAFVLIVGAALIAWYRHGRDPVYLDDPSIHIPAPPVGLTPAAGAVVRDGKSSRRALTTASLDLASRGLITFQAEATGLLGRTTELSIQTREATTADPVELARLERARRRPLDDATEFLLKRLRSLGGGAELIDHTELLSLGKDVSGFDKRIEEHVVDQGWFTEPPGKATSRWVAAGRAGDHRRGDLGVRRLPAAVRWPGRRRRVADRGGHRDADPRREHAVADDAGRDDPGDARGVPADPREDDGAGADDGRGRRDGGDPADREPRRRGRVGRRARAAVGGRGGPPADRRRRHVRGRAVRLHAGLVWRQLGRVLGRRVGRLGAGPDELLADPELRRHDGRPGDDRELARVVRIGRRWGWLQRRRIGRRRRRGRRRLLIAAGTLVAWEPRTRWRCSSNASTRVTSRPRSR